MGGWPGCRGRDLYKDVTVGRAALSYLLQMVYGFSYIIGLDL
jgi:hypothetical protein